MKKLPQIISDIGFDFAWDNKKVWALELPVEEIDLHELEWHFDIPFWNKYPEGYYDLTPNQVLNNPTKYKEESQKIENADMSYPLDIMFWRNRWLMLDGLHRLVRAKQLGWNTINVRKIPQSDISKITK